MWAEKRSAEQLEHVVVRRYGVGLRCSMCRDATQVQVWAWFPGPLLKPVHYPFVSPSPLRTPINAETRRSSMPHAFGSPAPRWPHPAPHLPLLVHTPADQHAYQLHFVLPCHTPLLTHTVANTHLQSNTQSSSTSSPSSTPCDMPLLIYTLANTHLQSNTQSSSTSSAREKARRTAR